MPSPKSKTSDALPEDSGWVQISKTIGSTILTPVQYKHWQLQMENGFHSCPSQLSHNTENTWIQPMHHSCSLSLPDWIQHSKGYKKNLWERSKEEGGESTDNRCLRIPVLLKCAKHWWNGFNSRTMGLVGGQVVKALDDRPRASEFQPHYSNRDFFT